MDPITLMAIGGAAQVGGGLLGYFLGRGDQKTADRLERAALEQYGEVTEETIAKVAPQLIPATELAKIQTDPAYKQAQLAALDRLMEVSDSGGMTLGDKATLNRVNDDLATQENAARSRIQNEMDSRGIGGGGTELAMLRASGQDKLKRQSQASMDVAAAAQQRALDAIIARGDMAGSLRAQDYGEQSAEAQAQDAINRYNTGVTNQHQYWMADQRMNNAGVQLNGQQRQADAKRKQGQDTRQTVAGVGQGVGQGFQYVAGQKAKQPAANPNPVQAAVQPGPYAAGYVPPEDDDTWPFGGN